MKQIIAVVAATLMWAGMAPVMAAPPAEAAPLPVAVTPAGPASAALAGTAAPAAARTVTAATMSGPVAASARPVAYDCDGWHRGQVRFRRIYLSCDGSVIVTVTGWKYWTAISARSLGGRVLVNTCRPDCAAGHYRKYASTLVLYRARSRHGVRYFTRMRLRYWHGRLRSYVYRWGRYPGGTRPVWVGGP